MKIIFDKKKRKFYYIKNKKKIYISNSAVYKFAVKNLNKKSKPNNQNINKINIKLGEAIKPKRKQRKRKLKLSNETKEQNNINNIKSSNYNSSGNSSGGGGGGGGYVNNDYKPPQIVMKQIEPKYLSNSGDTDEKINKKLKAIEGNLRTLFYDRIPEPHEREYLRTLNPPEHRPEVIEMPIEQAIIEGEAEAGENKPKSEELTFNMRGKIIKCPLCEQEYKNSKHNNVGFTNMFRHMMNHHKDDFKGKLTRQMIIDQTNKEIENQRDEEPTEEDERKAREFLALKRVPKLKEILKALGQNVKDKRQSRADEAEDERRRQKALDIWRTEEEPRDPPRRGRPLHRDDERL
jgi:hypothetical protein